ncbi:MAG: hypothetical protein K8R58_04540 [Bacteroidales bacterium]|nr:hypothetical protein [Bacteroidales bacterium]
MNIKVRSKFNKQIKSVKDKKLKLKILYIIEELEEKNSIKQIKNVKKIKGSENAFRIKLGDYRIGFFDEKKFIELAAFAHRKDIYRFFP